MPRPLAPLALVAFVAAAIGVLTYMVWRRQAGAGEAYTPQCKKPLVAGQYDWNRFLCCDTPWSSQPGCCAPGKVRGAYSWNKGRCCDTPWSGLKGCCPRGKVPGTMAYNGVLCCDNYYSLGGCVDPVTGQPRGAFGTPEGPPERIPPDNGTFMGRRCPPGKVFGSLIANMYKCCNSKNDTVNCVDAISV